MWLWARRCQEQSPEELLGNVFCACLCVLASAPRGLMVKDWSQGTDRWGQGLALSCCCPSMSCKQGWRWWEGWEPPAFWEWDQTRRNCSFLDILLSLQGFSVIIGFLCLIKTKRVLEYALNEYMFLLLRSNLKAWLKARLWAKACFHWL